MVEDIRSVFFQLYRDSITACRAHHIAGEHSMRMYTFFGPPVSLLLLLTSMYLLGVEKGILYVQLKEYQQPVGLVIGFLSAIVSGLSSLFNFKEDALRHKFAAERYNKLSRSVVALKIGECMSQDSFCAISNEFSHIQSASPPVSNKQYKAATESVSRTPVGGDYWPADQCE